MGFEFVDHTADVAVCAWGSTKEEAFREAARALFTIMVRIDRVVSRERFEVQLWEPTLEKLLVGWLAVLVAQKDLSGLVFSGFDVGIRPQNDGWLLTGVAGGERLDPRRHEPGSEVKGISYLALDVRVEGERWVARYVADV